MTGPEAISPIGLPRSHLQVVYEYSLYSTTGGNNVYLISAYLTVIDPHDRHFTQNV